MKNIINYIFIVLSLSSCLKDDDKTLVLPDGISSVAIQEVIPDSILTEIESYMPINSGSTPPDIEGAYLINPLKIVYSSTEGGYSINYNDITIRFVNQNEVTNIITYEAVENNSSDSSNAVSVSGTGSDFTAYFVTTGTSEGISIKQATIISGTKASSGIENLYYAFLMLDKGDDPDGKLVDVGTIRIFKDENDLASNTTWDETKNMILKSGKLTVSTKGQTTTTR